MIVVNAQALEHHYYTLTLLLERNIRSYNPVKISTLLVNHKDDPSLDRHVMKCVVFVDKLTAHGRHVQGNVLDLGSSKGPRFSVGHVRLGLHQKNIHPGVGGQYPTISVVCFNFLVKNWHIYFDSRFSLRYDKKSILRPWSIWLNFGASRTLNKKYGSHSCSFSSPKKMFTFNLFSK